MKQIKKYDPLELNAHLKLKRDVENALSEHWKTAGKDRSLPNPNLLYFYCDYELANKIASSGRLRVSGGVDTEDLKKRNISFEGEFPVGLYATDIAPWTDHGVSSEEMRQAFYSTEYGLVKSIDYFVAFIPCSGWKPVGSLTFASTSGIKHWCRKTGSKGDMISIEGIAYGKSLIECLPFRYHWFG